jgi:acylphosphatase
MSANRIHVSGRVQGVGFRYFVRKQATLLRVVGYAKNQADGSVEIFAQGDFDSLQELIELIKIGPMGSSVSECKVTEASTRALSGFEIL